MLQEIELIAGDSAAGRFRREGFLIVRQILTPAELPPLQVVAARLRAACEARPDLPGQRFWYGASVDRRALPPASHHGDFSWGVNEITRAELDALPLVAILARPRLQDLLETLLLWPRAWGLKALWAPRHSSYDLTWHRDAPHELDAAFACKPPANDHVQFNLALQPDDSFIVLPGSHRRALYPEEVAALRANRRAELPGALQVELQPGDAVFMDAHAYHRGRATAGAPRFSLHFSCQAQWVPLKPWGTPKEFARLCSPAFIGQLPEALRPLYRRLASAARCDDSEEWLKRRAEAFGVRAPWRDPLSD